MLHFPLLMINMSFHLGIMNIRFLLGGPLEKPQHEDIPINIQHLMIWKNDLPYKLFFIIAYRRNFVYVSQNTPELYIHACQVQELKQRT